MYPLIEVEWKGRGREMRLIVMFRLRYGEFVGAVALDDEGAVLMFEYAVLA